VADNSELSLDTKQLASFGAQFVAARPHIARDAFTRLQVDPVGLQASADLATAMRAHQEDLQLRVTAVDRGIAFVAATTFTNAKAIAEADSAHGRDTGRVVEDLFDKAPPLPADLPRIDPSLQKLP